MNYEDFERQYRGRFLMFMTEAWAVRKDAPASMGLTFDAHLLALKTLMRDVYSTLTAKPPQPAPSGAPTAKGVSK